MNDIRSLLRIAGRRLELASFGHVLHAVGLVLAVIALVLALADRAPGVAFVAWAWVAPALAAVGLAVAAVLWSRRRMSELQVALAVDERLDLREKLSTALHCEHRDDPFAQAAVADAVATAREPRTGETLRRRFTVGAPHRWWMSPLLIVLAAAVLQLPQADLFAADEDSADEDAIRTAQDDVRKSMEVLTKVVEDKPLLHDELADLMDALGEQGKNAAALRKPEQVRRDALKKVTELNRRLDDIINGEKGKTLKALEQMLSKLEGPESGAGKELAEALAKGDFAQAKQALEQMMEQARTGDLTDAQREQLAKALEDMAAQLDQLAQQQQQIQQALAAAGLDPQLAADPQALQLALQQAQNLNEQQRQQLQQMIQAQQQAQQMMQGLAGAMEQMAGAIQNGQLGQGGQMAGQLNQMEQLQLLLQQAQAAAGQCQGTGLGQGLTMSQAMQQWMKGNGMGQWGQGSGGKAPISRTPTGTTLTKADAPLGPGEIIASMLIDGTPMKGESRARLKEAFSAAAAGYDEALNEAALPRRYHEPQKHYFGELEAQVDAVTASVEDGEEGDGTSAGAEDGAESGSSDSGDGSTTEDR